MNNDYIESEVKLYVPDLAQVEANLLKIGAICTKPRILEKNIRYDLPDGSLTQEKRILRLRQDTEIRLTYKEPLADEDQPDQEGNISSRVEVETVIQDIDAMDLILRHLGYHSYMVYEKYRTTYELEGGEIVLDEMPYGNFVEIESSPEHIKHLIQLVGLSDAPKIDAGYVALFRMLKSKLGLVFNDLTFSNFKNVYVPISLFVDL